MSDEQGLLWKWRSGQRAEELRVAWNKKNGPDSDVAGGNLDGLLDCADDLESALRTLRERTVEKWGHDGPNIAWSQAGNWYAKQLDIAFQEIFGVGMKVGEAQRGGKS
jgi:hypothetical protein